MAFADTGIRTVQEGYLPHHVTFAGAVVEGGLVGYSAGWVAADGSPGIPARGVAAKSYAADEAGVMFLSAKVSGFTGGTAGAPLYMSNDAGKYSDSAGTYKQVVGWMVSDTEAVIAPNAMAGNVRIALIAGGAAGDHTVTGIAVGDELVFVAHISTAAAVATIANLTSEFTVGAGVINNAGGTDTTDDQLWVFYNDRT